jgi:hypothetical protein
MRLIVEGKGKGRESNFGIRDFQRFIRTTLDTRGGFSQRWLIMYMQHGG